MNIYNSYQKIDVFQARQAVESHKNALKADNPLETREAVDRALVSLTQEQRAKLIGIDGTFKSSPSNLTQLFTIPIVIDFFRFKSKLKKAQKIRSSKK